MFPHENPKSYENKFKSKKFTKWMDSAKVQWVYSNNSKINLRKIIKNIKNHKNSY